MNTKSNKEAMAPVETATRRALFLSHFTPSMMQPETLQAMLVQRGPLIDRCVQSVVHSVNSDSKHHHLFVGPRGIGKTHLISLLHHRLSQEKDISSKALVVWMREEEWGITNFMDLVLRILRTMDQTCPGLRLQQRMAPLYELSAAQAEQQASALLLEVLSGKTLVILMENLDDVFEQLGDGGQKQWRAFMQNHPQFVLVATTPSLFSGVSKRNSAFYGFFDTDILSELSLEEVIELLEKIALERNDKPLANFIRTPEGRARIRAVHHLAEGNPRIYIIFAQFLTQESLDELVQAFMHTLDELTPYYQSRMKELPGQQRKILEFLIHYRGAAPVKNIAKACFITHQTCSSQLKQLREKRYVRSYEMGRESFYELCEPMMRLCMEVKRQRGEPIGIFVEMLRIWYTLQELESWLSGSESLPSIDPCYIEAAINGLKNNQTDPKIAAIERDMEKLISINAWSHIWPLFEEAYLLQPTTWKNKQFITKGLFSIAASNFHILQNIDETQANVLDQAAADLIDELILPNDSDKTIIAKLQTIMRILFRLHANNLATTISAEQKLKKRLDQFPAHAFIALLYAAKTDMEAENINIGNPENSAHKTKIPLPEDSPFDKIIKYTLNYIDSGDARCLLGLPIEQRRLIRTTFKPALKTLETGNNQTNNTTNQD